MPVCLMMGHFFGLWDIAEPVSFVIGTPWYVGNHQLAQAILAQVARATSC